MTFLYVAAVIVGLFVMAAGMLSLRERSGMRHRVDETALAQWLAEQGFVQVEPDKVVSRRVRRSFKGVALDDSPVWLSDCGEQSRARVEIPGPPRPVEIQVRAKWDGKEDAKAGQTTVTIPVPPYVQVWGSAAAEDASTLGRMLSPQAVKRLADAGEGIAVWYMPDGLVVGERHPLTAETAARTLALVDDVARLLGPLVRELRDSRAPGDR